MKNPPFHLAISFELKKIIVLGKGGQLASELEFLKSKDQNWAFLSIDQLDICDKDAVLRYLKNNSCDVIINCAAYTAVDKAEEEIEACYNVNFKGVENLLGSINLNNTKLIHISTDYVFDGNKSIPYNEKHTASPNGVYGKSKLAGEKAISDSKVKSIIIRTSWLYSNYGNNFVKTMIKIGAQRGNIGVVADQFGSPTYANDLAKIIIKIVEDKNYNWSIGDIFHYSNEGSCTWHEFSSEIFRISKINVNVKKLTTDEFPTKAIRPKYSILDKSKLKEVFNIKVPHWKISLNQMLKKELISK